MLDVGHGNQYTQHLSTGFLLSEGVLTMQNEKRPYVRPQAMILGKATELTRTNQLDPFSDVPQGEIANNGNNPPGDS